MIHISVCEYLLVWLFFHDLLTTSNGQQIWLQEASTSKSWRSFSWLLNSRYSVQWLWSNMPRAHCISVSWKELMRILVFYIENITLLHYRRKYFSFRIVFLVGESKTWMSFKTINHTDNSRNCTKRCDDLSSRILKEIQGL